MLRNVKELIGYGIHAVDGDIGHVDDFYFDDDSWKIRHTIVNCGSWLNERKVLISPEAFKNIDWINRRFPINLTKEQVKKSPDIDTDRPVSRQEEIKLFTYYNWPMYWPHEANLLVEPAVSTKQDEIEDPAGTHLRSTKEVRGYSIESTDGKIGHVEDFIVDDQTWMLRYMVIDTKKWLPGGNVLIAISWIDSISWKDSQVSVDLTKEQIKNSPQTDLLVSINREFEEKLYDYYKRPKYWG